MFKITSQGEGRGFSFSRGKIIGGVIAVVFVLVAWAWYSNPLVVTVTGVGEVSVPPENALVSFIVSSASPDVNVAVGGVDGKIGQIKSALSSFSVSEEDISQTQVNVVPPSLMGGGSVDYSATVTMAVKVSDYSMVNALVSTLYAQGVSYVSQPVLSVENSDDLEKVKEFKSEEFEIIGGKEGTGTDEGCVIYRCITKEGKEFDARPRGTVEDRKQMLLDLPDSIGKPLTVRFAEYSDDGIPQQPVGVPIAEAVRDYE